MKYMARRPTTGLWLTRDLEITVDSRTRALSGPSTISGALDGSLAQRIMSDGKPLIDDWGTYIYAVNEDTGAIRNHGMVMPPTSYDTDVKILCSGFSSYPKGLIYRHAKLWGPQAYAPAAAEVLDEDGSVLAPATPEIPGIPRPLSIDIFRDLWAYVAANYTDLNVRVTDTRSGGVPMGTNEDPYRMQFWDSPDIGDAMENLAKDSPFDYVEAPLWMDAEPPPTEDPWVSYYSEVLGAPVGGAYAWPANYGSTQTDVKHFLRVGFPRLGRRRDDLRFMEGENIVVAPPINTSESANMVLGIGNGDPGPSMMYSFAAVEDGRVKRIAVVTDKTANGIQIKALTDSTLRDMQARPKIDTIGVVDHPNARLSAIDEGDEILVQGIHPEYGRYDTWVRIVGTTQGASETAAVFTVVETTQFTYARQSTGATPAL